MNIKKAAPFQIPLLKNTTSITAHSQKVTPGGVFTAIQGLNKDGHHYLKAAVQKGAGMLVVKEGAASPKLNFNGPVYAVPCPREALGVLLNKFYNFPSEKMFCIGVTGTNGKTTVSHITAFLLSRLGWKTGLIGTVQNGIIEEGVLTPVQLKKTFNPGALTTPPAEDLYALLHYFYSQSVQAVVMEASSIGLDQKRTHQVDFNLAVFTNLTKDHLDYHKNLNHYFEAKKMLFHPPAGKKTNGFLAVINFDDPYGVKLARGLTAPYISYGESEAGFKWEITSQNLQGSVFKVKFKASAGEGFLPLPGRYNVSNAAAALACVQAAGFSLEKAVQILPSFPGVKGRLERIKPKKNLLSGPAVFVDYAHTPEGLKSALTCLRQHKKNGRVICVFGCGGERDKTKRALMGREAERLADLVILTSDNPRSEDPCKIIKDITLSVLDKSRLIIEPLRFAAIQKALKAAGKNDLVLIAGKGHETSQIIGSRRIYHSDQTTALKILHSLHNQL